MLVTLHDAAVSRTLVGGWLDGGEMARKITDFGEQDVDGYLAGWIS